MGESEQHHLVGMGKVAECSGREWDAIPKQAFLPTAGLLGMERQASLDILCAPSGMADGDPRETCDHGCPKALQTLLCKPTLQQQSQGLG